MVPQAKRMPRHLGMAGTVLSVLAMLLAGCTTLPSCAWGKCAYPRSPALAPQMSERVYPLAFAQTYETVKEHFEQRGYPLAAVEENWIETGPYAERPFARFLGLQYQWRVQVRKMDSLNTAVLPRLYVLESGKARELSPGLWPEPYRFFYHEIERSFLDSIAGRQG